MMKYCLKYSGLTIFALICAILATAQSPKVLNKLHAKYNVVWPEDDGIMMVNRGGSRYAAPGAKSNGKFGFVDTLGQEIVPPMYDAAVRFRNGFAVVGRRDESGEFLWGLIDRRGTEVVPLTWRNLGSVYDGVCVATDGEGSNRVFSLVDTLGNVRILPYNLCDDFSGGLARVGAGTFTDTEKEITLTNGQNKTVTKSEFKGKYGYITPDGKIAIPVQFDAAGDFNGEDGVAAVGMQGKYYIKWGFCDRTGKLVVPCNYFSVERFYYNRAVVSKVLPGGKLGYGYIDHSGAEVIPCKYDMASGFRFPNTWIGVLQPDGEMAYALIDTTGKSVLSYLVLNLQDGGKYGQSVASYRDENGREFYGVIGITGKVLLPFEYDEITIFSEWKESEHCWKEAAVAMKDGQKFSFDISKRGK